MDDVVGTVKEMGNELAGRGVFPILFDSLAGLRYPHLIVREPLQLRVNVFRAWRVFLQFVMYLRREV